MKSNRAYYFGFAGALTMLFVAAAMMFMPNPGEATHTAGVVIPLSSEQLSYPQGLMQAAVPSGSTSVDTGRIVAGIGPHQLPFVGGMLKGLYTRIAQNDPPPKRLLLIGPNHDEAGNNQIKTANLIYRTPLGDVHADPGMVGRLVAAGIAVADEDVFVSEHAIYSHLIFIQSFLAEAAVVPLLLGNEITRSQAMQLAEFLANELGEEDAVVLSMDLSHYLDQRASERIDHRTIASLSAWQRVDFTKFNTDTPMGALVLTQFAELKGVSSGQELIRANSADFGADPTSTTGFVTMVFSSGH